MKKFKNKNVHSKNLSSVVGANNSCKVFLDYLIGKYDFDLDELETIGNMKHHFDNLNYIFSQIKN